MEKRVTEKNREKREMHDWHKEKEEYSE